MAREAGTQEFHLIGQYVVIGQIEEFILVGHERNRQQFHASFFWRPVGLAIVAATAGADDIGPNVFATLGDRLDVIARQVAYREFSTTVETQIFITAKEEFIFQRGIKTVAVHLAVTSHNAR